MGRKITPTAFPPDRAHWVGGRPSSHFRHTMAPQEAELSPARRKNAGVSAQGDVARSLGGSPLHAHRTEATQDMADYRPVDVSPDPPVALEQGQQHPLD